MKEVPAFSEERVRRHVLGRPHRLVVTCVPGFEDVTRSEIFALCGVEARKEDSGVVALEGKLATAIRLLTHARTASRVLIRLVDSHVGASEELFRKVYAIAWELFLPESCVLDIDVHVGKSRLSHEGRAGEIAFEAISSRIVDSGRRGPRFGVGGQRVVLRILENHALLSLDLSGEHLHRRGWRIQQNAAPLRENLAASLLAWAGWPGSHENLFDGMSGSGTFAIEAAGMAAGGVCRSGRGFAIETWPAYSAATRAWEERQVYAPLSRTVNAIDVDNEAVQIAGNNAVRAGLADAVTPRLRDFFETVPPGDSGLLVLNPPYGVRLQGDGDTEAFFRRIYSAVDGPWRSWKVLLLQPSDTRVKGERQISRRLVFPHGGLDIEARYFE